MYQNPLKKNEHFYPLDFSNKKQKKIKQERLKYDIKMDSTLNPQLNNEKDKQQKQTITLSKFVKNNINSEDSKKQQNLNADLQLVSPICSKQLVSKNLSQKFADLRNFIQEPFSLDFEQPLKEIKRKKEKIMINQTLIKNPRFQMSNEKVIKTTQNTIQEQPTQQKLVLSNNVGGIKHQDLRFLEKYQDQKQNPLLPQLPCQALNKYAKRNSLLQRLKLRKQSFVNHQSANNIQLNTSRISQSKRFIPETYSYVDNLLAKVQNKAFPQNHKRSNSSFQLRNNGKIVYLNNLKDNTKLQDLLPSSSFNRVNRSRLNFQDNSILQNKFSQRQLANRLVPSPNKSVFSNFQQQTEPEQVKKLDRTNIKNLKAQINLIAQRRLRNRTFQEKSKVCQTQRQITFNQDQNHREFQQKQRNSKFSSSIHKRVPLKLQITYHVSLSSLKSIINKYISSKNQLYRLAFKVPRIFLQSQLFTPSQSKSHLHQNSLILFESLKITQNNLRIKRYHNCIIFINDTNSGHIAVIWHYSGKRYLGQWRYDYLDEGSKNGLGLEWEPNEFIYYGEFRKNVKWGIGAMKLGPQKVKAGYWREGIYVGQRMDRQSEEQIQNEPLEDQEKYNFQQNQTHNMTHKYYDDEDERY